VSTTETTDVLAAAGAALRAGGRNQAADELDRPAGDQEHHIPSILVAGEDKRGKSSLVNALLGSPDLSPVGVEVTTGCPISMFHSDPPRAAIVRYGQATPEAVSLEDAQRLSTIQGNPQNAENIRAVQIGVQSDLLEHLLLVDTPGVGGLDSGHAELTLQTLVFADALLFVIEAGTQFGAGELEFLRRASSRIETVILVMTKTDLHRGWRTILDDNQRLLQSAAPRFTACPVVPVSSVLAVRAMRSTDPEDVEALMEESGIPKLRQVLIDHVARRSGILATANRLRSAVGPLNVMDRAISERLAILDAGSGAKQDLEAEQKRLAALSRDKTEWPRKLDREIRRLTLERNEEVTRGMVEIRRRYDERIKNPKKEDADTLPGELIADLTALAGHVNELATQRLMEIVDAMLNDIDDGGALRESIAKLGTTDLQERLSSLGLGSTRLAGHEKLLIVSSFSTGRSMGSLMSGSGLGVAVSAFVAPPIGIAVGLGVGAFFAYQAFRGRSKQMFASEFRSWMNEQCTQAQVTINTTFQREMIDLQEEIRDLVRDVLAERERQINDSLKEAREVQQQAETEKEQTKANLGKRRQMARQARKGIMDALESLGVGADGKLESST
jgi:GTPase SAR1 family protein